MRLNQLVCTGAGSSYPDNSISTFITDNKALLRRMFGENQEQVQPLVTTPKPKLTLVRSFAHTSFVAAPLLKTGQFASATKFQR